MSTIPPFPDSTARPPAAMEALPPPGARKPVVLLVEDDPDILRVLERNLSRQDYDILKATDGEAGLATARARLPDLVLLDVMLPRLNGFEVLRKLKEEPATSGIMVILVTGCGSLDHKVRGLDSGADDYVTKPFQIPELLARVRSALRIKRLTDDLAVRNQELRRSQRSMVQSKKMATIGLLASGIAHEFNNIMAGISGYAQLARKDPRYREALVDVALVQTQRALELTRSLSTYNRGSEENAQCDVVQVIENALCLVAKQIESTEITLEREFAESPRVSLSPTQLQEVVLNLVLNAIQAIDRQPGLVRIRVAPAADPTRVVVEVTDSGMGIPEENIERIFDPFFTTKGALGGGSQSGTGLGLTVCYNIVHSSGGQIDVWSRPGVGTTFQVSLLRAKVAAAPESPESTAGAAPAPVTGRPLRILVVDDEEISREVIRSFLVGQDVTTCATAREAIAACAGDRFDYVILDVALRGSVNGFQAFEEIAKLPAPPRVIFASGRFPDPVYRRYLQRAHGHLLKPFQFDSLLRLLGLPARREPSREEVQAMVETASGD